MPYTSAGRKRSRKQQENHKTNHSLISYTKAPGKNITPKNNEMKSSIDKKRYNFMWDHSKRKIDTKHSILDVNNKSYVYITTNPLD